jgi:hypothetical protein
MLTNNAGFNCNASRVLVTQAGWAGRSDLLAAIRRLLSGVPHRRAFYPGAVERWQAFLAAHPEAEQFGDRRFGRMPWTFISGVPAEREGEICFTTEAFAPIFAETPIAAETAARFLDRAVEFANERLWGTLNATLVVHSSSLRDEATRDAFERALAHLRFGTVTVNHWAGVGYGLGATPWGAYPGSTLADIQSGSGFVHNTLMFSRPEKAIVRSPFRAWPKPPWFPSHRTAPELGRALTAFEASPSPAKLPAIFRLAMTG